MRLEVTRIAQDGDIRRRMLDTTGRVDAGRWENLVAQAPAAPPPYRAAPGDTVYQISVGERTLMVTQGAFQAASAALQASLTRGSGNSYVNLNTASLDAALAATLRNTLNIQNTVDVPAGTEIAFMLNQPIDFADAYRLAPTGAR